MKLNKWHMEIINHRPDDCIVECCSTSEESLYTEEQIEEAITLLRTKADSGYLVYAELTAVEQTVMTDIVNGSTTACCYVQNRRERNRRNRVELSHVNEYIAICNAGQQLGKECRTTFPEI